MKMVELNSNDMERSQNGYEHSRTGANIKHRICPYFALNLNRTYFGLPRCPAPWSADYSPASLFVL